MSYVETFTDNYNALCGIIIALFSFLFGDHWILFAALLLFNICDWFTGWYKGRATKSESSVKGLQGVLKKLGYWVVIMVAFMMGAVFIEIGDIIGVNLSITTLFGWYVVASLMVNEIRSIVENLIGAGFNVPYILVKGLDVADKTIDGKLHLLFDDESTPENVKVDLSIPEEDLKGKKTIVLKIED